MRQVAQGWHANVSATRPIMKKVQRVEAPCSNCLTSTFHKVLHSEEREIPRDWWPEDQELVYSDPDWKPDTFQLIECSGCGRLSFAHKYMEFEYTDDGGMRGDKEGPLFEVIDYYPSPVSRRKPAWLTAQPKPVTLFADVTGFIEATGVPVDLRELLNEIYEAIRGRQYRLAAMGIRALLEQVMVNNVGDHGSFARNLDAFYEKGFISLVQRDSMTAILDVGHAAMHRAYQPTESDLTTALDIAEGVFAAIYVHTSAATEVSDRVPPRKRPGK
jgi:hypothetical protein